MVFMMPYVMHMSTMPKVKNICFLHVASCMRMRTRYLIQDEGLNRKHRGTIQRAGDDRTDIRSMKFNSRIISDNTGLIII